MARHGSVSLLAFLILGGCLGEDCEDNLQSPWAPHPIQATDAAYPCPPAPHLASDLSTNSYYTDEHHSIVDPSLKKAYEEATASFTQAARAVVKAADNYRTTGSRAAAQCVITLLDTAAKDRALAGKMLSHQAFYVQGWSLSAWAIAYLKVRGSGAASAEETKEITAWHRKMAEDNRDYYESKRHNPQSDAHNNHLYWAGLAISATGVANHDHKLFKWGMDAYKEGVGDITAEGTLPAEMNRAARVLHYHLYALGPLIMLAEFGEANGLDLYAEKKYAIKRLVERCVSGLQDPSYFVQHTGVAQDMPAAINAEEIGWAKPYVRRFPDPVISSLMAKAPWLDYTTWGGLPPD